MLKSLLSKILVWTALPVAFNLCFFVLLDDDIDKVAWTCYMFFHISYLMLFFTSYYFESYKNVGVLNRTLYMISMIYVFVELLTACYFLYDDSVSYSFSLIIQIIELFIYVLVFCGSVLGNVETTKASIRDLNNSQFVNDSINILKTAGALTKNDARKLQFDSLLEDFCSSPMLSNINSVEVEEKIRHLLHEVCDEQTPMTAELLSTKVDEIKILLDLRKNRLNNY